MHNDFEMIKLVVRANPITQAIFFELFHNYFVVQFLVVPQVLINIPKKLMLIEDPWDYLVPWIV